MIVESTYLPAEARVKGHGEYWVLGLTVDEARMVRDWAARWECDVEEVLRRIVAQAVEQAQAEQTLP